MRMVWVSRRGGTFIARWGRPAIPAAMIRLHSPSLLSSCCSSSSMGVIYSRHSQSRRARAAMTGFPLLERFALLEVTKKLDLELELLAPGRLSSSLLLLRVAVAVLALPALLKGK